LRAANCKNNFPFPRDLMSGVARLRLPFNVLLFNFIPTSVAGELSWVRLTLWPRPSLFCVCFFQCRPNPETEQLFVRRRPNHLCYLEDSGHSHFPTFFGVPLDWPLVIASQSISFAFFSTSAAGCYQLRRHRLLLIIGVILASCGPGSFRVVRQFAYAFDPFQGRTFFSLPLLD